LIGTVFHNRYEIIEKIGEGGMATVYKAKCRLLNRMVAVKVLHPQFTHDEDFIQRFQHEAQAAARLSHPNIVNIYDVGTEGQVHYIVMEYVEGKNLKRLLREEGILPVKQALDIAQQIASALIQAHQHDIVHCDIKPHNILITDDGRVKVVDFGIARAASSSTINLSGTVIGSVHYLSPEQAQGLGVDKRSDLYALGVVLYEMVVGKPPFNGENPIAIALRQIQEEVSFPSDLKLPKELKALINKALEKDPAKRYQTANEMWRDLKRCIDKIAGDPDYETDEFHTQVFPSLAVPKEGVREVRGGEKRDRKKWGWKKIILGALLIIGFGVIVGAGIGLLMFGGGEEVTVPDLTGKTLQEAEKLLEDLGLSVGDVTEQYSESVEPNRIIASDPPAGEKIKKGREVDLIISMGESLARVPMLINKTERQAELDLAEAGLVVGERTEEFSNDVPAGYIIDQSPAPNTKVESGTPVDIIVSKGPELKTVTLPDFRGQDLNKVKERLRSLNLIPGSVQEVVTEEFKAGIVLEQEPEPGTLVKEGSTVNLVVGKGTTKTHDISLTVPQGPDQQKIEIVVRDARGSRTVYSDLHAPGDRVVKEITWTGEEAVVQVLIDGNVRFEQTLR